MRYFVYIQLILFGFMWPLNAAPGQGRELLIYAESSTRHAMEEVAQLYSQRYHQAVRFYFDDSAELSARLTQGETADILLDIPAKDSSSFRVQSGASGDTSRMIFGDRLVLVSKKDSAWLISFRSDQLEIPDPLLRGTFALPDPEHRLRAGFMLEALRYYELWPRLESQSRMVSNMDEVAQLLDKGDIEAGVITVSAAVRNFGKVRVVAEIPEISHTPIRYRINLMQDDPAVRHFYDFVFTPEAQRIYGKHGFLPVRG